MPKYEALEILVKHGEVYPIGSTIELTEEQGEALGDKVKHYEAGELKEEGTVYSEAEFRALSADNQKLLVEAANGDLNEVTNADKRWNYISANQ